MPGIAVADGRGDGLAAALLVVLRLRLRRRRHARNAPLLRQQPRHLGSRLLDHPDDGRTWETISS